MTRAIARKDNGPTTVLSTTNLLRPAGQNTGGRSALCLNSQSPKTGQVGTRLSYQSFLAVMMPRKGLCHETHLREKEQGY